MISKVLVVNKYHFISGGAERYFFSVMEALRKKGIEPIPFSVNYSKTVPTSYQKYFIDPVIHDGQTKMQNQHPNFGEKLLLAERAIFSREAFRAIKRICLEEKPDVAYFLNFNSHISPSGIAACVDSKVPVVMRMSDFNLVCGSNMYYRNGHPCMDCKKGLHYSVIHRCVHGSFGKSVVNAAALVFHRLWGIYRQVRAFVAPTQFMKNELIEYGIPEQKVHQINTFAMAQAKLQPDLDHPYILFVGRLAPYKGIDTAIKAFGQIENKVNVTFKVVGDEQDRDAARVKALAQQLNVKKIEFLPFERDQKKLIELIQKALFTLVPSENYENLPNTVLESFSCGRPVIATRLGSLPDLVKDGECGLLYEFGNSQDLAQKIEFLINHEAERERLGQNAYQRLIQEYSEESHLDKLLSLFENISH